MISVAMLLPSLLLFLSLQLLSSCLRRCFAVVVIVVVVVIIVDIVIVVLLRLLSSLLLIRIKIETLFKAIASGPIVGWQLD